MRSKQTWVPGAALLLSMLLLIGARAYFDLFFSTNPSVGIIVAEIVSFGIPAVLVYRLRDDRFRINLRSQKRKSYYLQYMGFTFHFGMVIAFVSFLLNFLIYLISGSTEMTLTNVTTGSMAGSKLGILSFIAIVIVPPIVEEIFLRGAIFSAMENVASTAVCIVFSGLCFAMLHVDLYNFVGPFLAGCAYAFLAYSYDSIWPAIIAHGLNNLYYYIINHLITVYSSFGIWRYFTAINLILFLLALYFMLKVLEIQLHQKKLLPFAGKNVRLKDMLSDIVGNAAFFAFIAAFIIFILITVFM